ncbi:AcrR family transcriptional regulator [Marmoricola sp. OAE513]|uniref:TetR/AcrR family transcriptional regulator n=1 Tax=Marmoricola sp. OAE513 TaxID=2817894 RepID=UPI001AE72FA5
MRTHGWRGQPPSDADEARARILTATRTRLSEAGTTSTSEVAELIGVTRQTVYRYFPTTGDLLNAAAADAVIGLEAQLIKHVVEHLARTGGDAADAAVEIVAYVYEHLRDDPALNRLMAPGRISSTVAGLTTPSAIALGRDWLAHFPVDWEAVGLVGEAQAEFVEHLLRTLQSFVVDPGEPARSGAELRAYLQRWLAPALRR